MMLDSNIASMPIDSHRLALYTTHTPAANPHRLHPLCRKRKQQRFNSIGVGEASPCVCVCEVRVRERRQREQKERMRAVGGDVYRVIHSPFVVVRDKPCVRTGEIMGGKREGEYVLVKAVDNDTHWATLDIEHEGFEKDAFMLLEGKSVGLGTLLERVDTNDF